MVSMDYMVIIMRMAEMNLNQRELAKKMGVTASFVCNILKRRRKSTRLSTASMLAKALNLPVEAIIKT